jgi:cysteine desulfurase/selenocysteine lyase
MNINNLRADFPFLQGESPLIYLDNAATTQKPLSVLQAVMDFYSHHYANVHRGVYPLAEEATTAYEKARETIAQAVGARSASEIVFTRGTTESINLVAASWAAYALEAGDEIMLPESEHHANLIPWQQLALSHGIRLLFWPVQKDGTLLLADFERLLTRKTKLITLSHVSHVTGAHCDVTSVVRLARTVGARVLLDAAQSIPHQNLNLAQLGVDFCAFSGHKMLAPTGIGVLYIASDLHDAMQPYQTGGGMVRSVTFNQSTWLPVPHRLEAGTPAIAQVIGLAAAFNYLQEHVDMHWLRSHEAMLCARFIDGLATIPGTKIIGPIDELKKTGHVVSFTMQGIHPHDVASYLGQYGVCMRAGHHCAQPLAERLGLDASVRASFYLYNTIQEVEQCIEVVSRMRDHFLR